MYKKIIFLFCFFCFAGFARNTQETFLRANKLYEEKEYVKALEEYQKIKNKGAAVHYNMGNCYYLIGNESEALICYKRAKKRAKNKLIDDCNYNIDVIRKNTNTTYFQKLINFLDKQLYHFSLLFFQLLFLVVWLLLFLVVYKRNNAVSNVFAGVLLLCLVPLSAVLYIKNKRQTSHLGIVRLSTPLYAGPNRQYHARDKLSVNQEVAIKETKDEWLKIQYNKMTGWIPKDTISLI